MYILKMKNFLLILSFFFISMSFGQEFKAKRIFINNILESYKWNKRILLFIANESDVALIKEVNNYLRPVKGQTNTWQNQGFRYFSISYAWNDRLHSTSGSNHSLKSGSLFLAYFVIET